MVASKTEIEDPAPLSGPRCLAAWSRRAKLQTVEEGRWPPALVPERREQAIRLLSVYIDLTEEPSPLVVIRLLELLRIDEGLDAIELVERFKNSIIVPEFHVAWARMVVRYRDPSLAHQLFADPAFLVDAVRAVEPAVIYRLLKLIESEEAYGFLREALDLAAANENLGQIRALANIFREEGDLDELEFRLSQHMSSKAVQEIVLGARRQSRRRLPLESDR